MNISTQWNSNNLEPTKKYIWHYQYTMHLIVISCFNIPLNEFNFSKIKNISNVLFLNLIQHVLMMCYSWHIFDNY
jgi:hypothetical protein